MSGYFDHARREILPVLPERAGRLLDLGCGTGATLEAIRGVRAVEWAGGVELSAGAAATARNRFDRLWQDDLERVPLEAELSPGSLDLILCLDILEHLVEPWDMVRRLTPLLGPGGRMIVSVPNIRHWRFVWRLLMRGDFRYRDAGLLDRTHLRFFTRETAIELITAGGLDLVYCRSATCYSGLDTRKILIKVFGVRMEAILAKQFVLAADRGPA